MTSSTPSVENGLVLSIDWFEKGESAYGMMGKLCLANASDIALVCGAMLGASPALGDAGDATSRSFLGIAWFRPKKAWHPRGPMFQSESVAELLAGRDGVEFGTPTLRFCLRCLESGYHSTVSQVAGIMRCPYHHCKFSSQCPHCGKTAGLFAADQGLASPFTCPACRLSYTDAWKGIESCKLWRRATGLGEVHEQLAARLRHVRGARVGWPDLSGWRDQPFATPESRSAGMLKAYETVTGAIIDRDPDDRPFRLYAVERTRAFPIVYLAERKALLKAVRRQIMKRTGIRGKGVKHLSKLFEIKPRADSGNRYRPQRNVIPKQGASPEMRAGLQWMQRFRIMPFGDDFVRRRQFFDPPKTLLDWPHVPASTETWLAFAWECFNAELRFARDAVKLNKGFDDAVDWTLKDVPPTLALLTRLPKAGEYVDMFLVTSTE